MIVYSQESNKEGNMKIQRAEHRTEETRNINGIYKYIHDMRNYKVLLGVV